MKVGRLILSSFFVIALAGGERQGVENELFREQSTTEPAIITSSSSVDINTTPVDARPEIEINNFSLRSHRLQLGDNEHRNSSTDSIVDTTVSYPNDDLHDHNKETFFDYNAETTSALIDTSYDAAEADDMEWTTNVPQENNIELKNIFDDKFTPQEQEFTRGITVIQDWLKESKNDDFEVTTDIIQDTTRINQEIHEEIVSKLVEKVQDELVELEVLREDQIKEQEEIEETVEHLQENLETIMNMKNGNENMKKSLDATTEKTEEETTLKELDEVIQNTLKRVTEIFDETDNSLETTSNIENFTENESENTKATESVNTSTESTKSTLIEEEMAENNAINDNNPPTTETDTIIEENIEKTAVPSVQQKPDDIENSIENNNKDTVKKETVEMKEIVEKKTTGTNREPESRDSTETSNSDETPNREIINTIPEESQENTEDVPTITPANRGNTKETTDEIVILPKLKEIIEKSDGEEDLTLSLIPVKKIGEKPTTPTQSMEPIESISTFNRVVHKIIGDVIEDIEEAVQEVDEQQELETSTISKRPIIDDESVKKLVEESDRLRDIVKEILDKEDKVISSNTLNSNSEDSKEIVAGTIDETPKNPLRPSGNAKSLNWDPNDETMESLEETNQEDSVEVATLSGIVYDDSGDMCINATKLAIKITTKETSFWVPTDALVAGNCNKSGSYLRFSWTQDKFDENLTLSLDRERGDTVVTQIVIETHKEHLMSAQLKVRLSIEPVNVDLPGNVLLEIINPAIRVYRNEEIATAAGEILTANKALALQIASGALCMMCVLISLAIFTYRKIRNKTRIFKVSLDK